MTAAPIWQRPTPCPHPAPVSSNHAGIPSASVSPFSTMNAELNKWVGESVRRISSSLPMISVFSVPTIFSLQIRPDFPRSTGMRSTIFP